MMAAQFAASLQFPPSVPTQYRLAAWTAGTLKKPVKARTASKSGRDAVGLERRAWRIRGRGVGEQSIVSRIAARSRPENRWVGEAAAFSHLVGVVGNTSRDRRSSVGVL